MRRIHFLSVLLLLTTIFSAVNAQIPAFPGAEGGGMFTTGGRGGKVYFVTSLADDKTEGTLRWALGKTGPRTILFKVSGVINLTSTLRITKGDVTVAGQSAPGEGICIKGYTFAIDANNVILRYMRFRMGDINAVQDDALKGNGTKNVIIDHCSISWSTDECASFYGNENFTMQYCIVSESLRNSVHKKGVHGFGGIWGGKNASFHHNIIAHHDSRNPRFNGLKREGLKYGTDVDLERVDFRNNVIYNWGHHSSYGGESGQYNIVANYFKAGPATPAKVRNRITNIDIDAQPDSCPPGYGTYYIADNYVHGFDNVSKNNWEGVEPDKAVKLNIAKASTPFEVTPVTTEKAEKAFTNVLKSAGASYFRDIIDARIVEEIATGTATFKGSVSGTPGLIDSQSDVGGWPEYKQGTAPTDTDNDGIPDGWLDKNYPGKQASDTDAKTGYTLLEMYLNSMVK